MALLQVLGLRPPAARSGAPAPGVAAAVQQVGGRKFESARAQIKTDLVDSPQAHATQGDVSTKLTLKADAEGQVARLPAALFTGKGEADFNKARADAQKAVDALDALANKAAIQTAIADARAKLTQADADAARKDHGAGLKHVMEAQLISVHAKK